MACHGKGSAESYVCLCYLHYKNEMRASSQLGLRGRHGKCIHVVRFSAVMIHVHVVVCRSKLTSPF